jgi:hypothetical protein
MSVSRETRQWQRLFCPHCEAKVSKSTYYRHREEHYDLCTGAWRKCTDDPVVCDSLRESVAISSRTQVLTTTTLVRTKATHTQKAMIPAALASTSVCIINIIHEYNIIRMRITENSENSNSDSESESNESDNEQLHSDEINQGR